MLLCLNDSRHVKTTYLCGIDNTANGKLSVLCADCLHTIPSVLEQRYPASDNPSHMVHSLSPGEGSARKGYYFYASGIYKGRDFTA